MSVWTKSYSTLSAINPYACLFCARSGEITNDEFFLIQVGLRSDIRGNEMSKLSAWSELTNSQTPSSANLETAANSQPLEASASALLLADSQPHPPEPLQGIMTELGIPDDKQIAKRVLSLVEHPQVQCDRSPISPYVSGANLDDNCGLPMNALYQSVESSVTQAISRPNGDLKFGTAFKLCDTQEDKCFYVTNNHVSGGADQVGIVDESGKTVQYEKVVARDEANDLVLVAVPKADTRKSVMVGNPAQPQVGDSVFIVGHPFGYPHDVISAGQVRSTMGFADVEDPETKQVRRMQNLLVTDVFAQHGNSGGPEFDKNGNVIGVKTIAINGGSLTVPIDRVLKLVHDTKLP